MNQIDEAALTLVVETMRRKGPTERRRIDQMLASGREWTDVARYSAFHCQVERLNLPPWLVAPCDVRDIARSLVATDDRAERTGLRSAALLRERMQRCGVSKYHPSPIHACEEAEQRRTPAK